MNTLACVDKLCDLRYTEGTGGGRDREEESYKNQLVPRQV